MMVSAVRRYILAVFVVTICIKFYQFLSLDNHESHLIDRTRDHFTATSNNSQVCDKECQRFLSLFSSWPADKPRAVIYYLAYSKTVFKLNTSIHYLDANFNNRFQYPVIIFIEEDLNNVEGHQLLRSFTGSDSLSQSRLFIQVVHFSVPEFLTRPIPKRAGNGKSIGYRHMCRFHAKTVYEHPTLTSSQPAIEFAWRLDDDSFLYRTVSYDVFSFMKNHHISYGYIQVRDEAPSLIRGLWETVDEYLRKEDIRRTEFYNNWRHTKIYYTNFEVSSLSVWLSKEYRRFIDHIDQHGGIFYKRWGDAPIKTIAVTLFIPVSQTHHFKDIPYKHNIYTNRGKSTF